MRSIVYRLFRRVRRRLASDLEADPSLLYILLLVGVLTGFWFWHLIPNFATRDEHARLLDVLPMIGALVVDPGIESLRQGVTQGRMYGATFYLNALALIPAVLFAILTGKLAVFVSFYRPYKPTDIWAIDTDLWYLWHDTPQWLWTSSLLVLRFFSVIFAIGCVYLTYRIGTTIRDRATGRLAGTLLALTFGFVVTAHEAGEDVPMLFLLLLVIYLALRYLQSGNETDLLIGCVVGGFAIAFKLTAIVGVLALGTAYLLRARRTGTDWYTAIARPRLIITGLVLGISAIVFGYPSILLTGPDALADRIFRGVSNKGTVTGGRTASAGWWFLRGYLNGLGLPLFLAAIGGILASISQLRKRSRETEGVAVVLIVFGCCVFMLSWWEYIRVHHLLPTFPLVMLLVSVALLRLRDHKPLIARTLVVVLLVSSGLYTGYGDVAYATQPRDEATQWLSTHAPDNATVEVYVEDPQDAAVPHGMHTSHYGHRNDSHAQIPRNRPSATEWMRALPERCPKYVELTHEDLLYLAPNSPSARSWQYHKYPKRSDYIRRLMNSPTDRYEIAAEFGPRPPFFETLPRSQHLPEFVRIGLVPRTIQYGDEQDLGPEQYVVILERTSHCAQPDTAEPHEQPVNDNSTRKRSQSTGPLFP